VADAEVDKLLAQLARKELAATEREEVVRRSVQLVVARLLHPWRSASRTRAAGGSSRGSMGWPS
jgi:hypothetical protein